MMELPSGYSLILFDFANWSTVCCIIRIAIASNRIARLLWTLVFFALLSVFVFLIVTCVIKLFSYPAEITSNLIFEEQVFPTISFCNYNPLKLSVISAGGVYAPILQLMNEYQAAQAGSKSATNIYGLQSLASSSFSLDEVARDQLYALMGQLEQKDVIAASYSLQDLLTECSIGGVTCDGSAFSSFLHPQYGQCFSFTVNMSITRPGTEQGLKMLLTSHQDISSSSSIDLLPTTGVAGIRLSVHSSGAFPSLDTRGLTLGVGMQSLVGLTKTQYTRIKRPYGRCVDKQSALDNYYSSFAYSLDTCFASCLQRAAVATCGCANPLFRKNDSMAYCSTPAQVLCLQSLKGSQKASNVTNVNAVAECGCDPPCAETVYTPSISQSAYPSVQYNVATGTEAQQAALMQQQGVPANWTWTPPTWPTTTTTTDDDDDDVDDEDDDPTEGQVEEEPSKQRRRKRSINTTGTATSQPSKAGLGSCIGWNANFPNVSACRQWYAENALMVQIYFTSLEYEKHVESASYTFSNLLNDIGGNAGLWLGLSVVSAIEIAGLLFITLVYIVSCRRLTIRPHENPEDDEMRRKREADRSAQRGKAHFVP